MSIQAGSAQSVKVDGGEMPASEVKIYTKKEVEAFVAEISKRILEPQTSHLHSVLAINHLLRQANMPDLLDTDLKDQLRDLWIKLKSTGMQLNDPPLLFANASSAVAAEPR